MAFSCKKDVKSPGILPLASPSNTFHVKSNYCKKNVIIYVEMIHSASMNRLKTQQELLIEGQKISWLMYLQTAGSIKLNFKKEGWIKNKDKI